MKLPADLEASFWAELQELEEVKRMRYISSVERIGMIKGMEQGLQQGALRPLLRLLEHRFGPISEEAQKQLQTLTVEQIEEFVDVALAANSMTEFAARLPRQASDSAEVAE